MTAGLQPKYSILAEVAQVFISYKHVEPDQSLANQLADAISTQHLVFIDSGIPLGQEWGDVIHQHLGSADFLAALVSQQSAESPMVVAEIEQAHRLNVAYKRPGIIPIRIMFEGQLRYPLSAYMSRFQQGVWNGPADTPRLTSQVLEAIRSGPLQRTHPAEQRQEMIARVRADWVKGVLEKSLYETARIDLGLTTRPGAVERGIDVLIQRPGEESQPLHPGTRLLSVFDDQLGQLLVLGAPGAGKTTLLLELARDLLDRAEQEVTHPIPVVFNLSSWARRGAPLDEWMAEELRARSDAPRRLAREWVARDQILPLLDGLDEVASDRREACVDAINAYRDEHGWVQLVVCSRIAEYEALATKLRLPGAIAVQPLTRTQIQDYLESAGRALEGVRQALQVDTTWWDLLETPLMLSIAVLAYKGRQPERIGSAEGSLESRQEALFSAYVQEMFRRRSKETRFPPEQMRRWLSWLACRMVARGQTMFQIEDVRSAWVGIPRLRVIAIGIIAAIATLLSGLLGYLNLVIVDFTSGSSFLESLHDSINIYRFVFMAPVGTILALTRGRSAVPAEILAPHWPGAKRLFSSILKQAVLGGVLGSILGAAGCFVSGGFSSEYVDVGAKVFGFAGAVAFGLAGAINSLIIARVAGVRSSPNLALSSSLRSSLTCFAGAALLSIPFVLIEKSKHFGNLEDAIVGGELFAWMGLFISLEKGGYFLLDHFVTRYLLCRRNLVPWALVRFLDTAAERILLRKVGGGYIFVHRTLLEHFAKSFN
jgi:hypothetical protein